MCWVLSSPKTSAKIVPASESNTVNSRWLFLAFGTLLAFKESWASPAPFKYYFLLERSLLHCWLLNLYLLWGWRLSFCPWHHWVCEVSTATQPFAQRLRGHLGNVGFFIPNGFPTQTWCQDKAGPCYWTALFMHDSRLCNYIVHNPG